MAIQFFKDQVQVLSLWCTLIQVLLIRSDPVQVLSIQSDPIRTEFCKHPQKTNSTWHLHIIGGHVRWQACAIWAQCKFSCPNKQSTVYSHSPIFECFRPFYALVLHAWRKRIRRTGKRRAVIGFWPGRGQQRRNIRRETSQHAKDNVSDSNISMSHADI